MNELEFAKKLIKDGCKMSPKPEKEELIGKVVEKLSKEEPMTNQEIDKWYNLVSEMVNNYY